MKIYILYAMLYFSFYIIGAYATTDIIRLLKGSTLSVGNSNCYCPICGCKIPLTNQIPIISYVLNKGKCRGCKSKIPFLNIFFEVFIFIVFSLVATLTSFSWIGYIFCLIIYQITKIAFICSKGLIETNRFKNIARSIFNNMVVFSLLALIFGFRHLVI